MGWFWADSQNSKQQFPSTNAAQCPVDHSKYTAPACPMKKPNTSDDEEVLNPLNNMPMSISSELAPGQKVKLSTERTISSIPRGGSEDQGLWEYPSPQQMLNAMLKKGKGQGIPEDAVESMVDVHNFLNEGAWQQILQWESQYTSESHVEPRLKNFTGKPYDLSPKAKLYLKLGEYFPEHFNSVPPFDRHDWFVLRSLGQDKGWKEVRYIIDYYGAPDDEETGMPAFVLDTRPALDDMQSIRDRIYHWAKPTWQKAMGEEA